MVWEQGSHLPWSLQRSTDLPRTQQSGTVLSSHTLVLQLSQANSGRWQGRSHIPCSPGAPTRFAFPPHKVGMGEKSAHGTSLQTRKRAPSWQMWALARDGACAQPDLQRNKVRPSCDIQVGWERNTECKGTGVQETRTALRKAAGHSLHCPRPAGGAGEESRKE